MNEEMVQFSYFNLKNFTCSTSDIEDISPGFVIRHKIKIDVDILAYSGIEIE